MDELDFYRLLRQYLPRNNQVTEDLYKEVTSRLSKEQAKKEQIKWNELCKLIEDTARTYELKNDDLVDITIDIDYCIITITNNNT